MITENFKFKLNCKAFNHDNENFDNGTIYNAIAAGDEIIVLWTDKDDKKLKVNYTQNQANDALKGKFWLLVG
jgi:hypothetical protein